VKRERKIERERAEETQRDREREREKGTHTTPSTNLKRSKGSWKLNGKADAEDDE
jgi:hypothetical protein